jgi:two-component system cell cycle response regulator
MVQFLLESISDAVWLIDPDTGAVVDCNDATVDLLCCTSRADLIGKRFEDLAAPEQKVGAPTVEPDLPVAERFRSRGSTFNWRVRRFDGTEVILEASATAIARDGEPIIVLVSRLPGKRKEVKHALEDSEERFRSFFERNAQHLLLESERRLRESEARFGTAFRASPALMTILRLSDQKYVEVNDAFVRWFGLNRDEIIGRDTNCMAVKSKWRVNSEKAQWSL